ncbi:MAG: hypothetical protein ACI8WB_005229, partial [Phenylobacterium sp.]
TQTVTYDLYAPIFRAKMPCSEAKSKHAEQLQSCFKKGGL